MDLRLGYLVVFILLVRTGWCEVGKFDASMGLQGRTLPAVGAELYAEGGFNQLIWGKKNEPKDFLYGLVRPNVGISTSGVNDSAKVELEFFPISILGIASGRQYIHSNFDFKFFDCDKVVCKGSFERNYVEGKMVLGHQGWIVVGHYKIDTLTANDHSQPIADWRNVIIGNSGRDTQIDQKLILGKTLGMDLAGIYLENTQFMCSKESKESFMGIYQKRSGDTSYMLGAGLFHTDHQPMGGQLYFRLNHILISSLKIF